MNLKPDSRTGDIWIDANTIKAPAVKGATWVAHGISGAMEFSDGTDDTIVANIRIPHRFNIHISPEFVLKWSAPGTSPGNCEWQLEYVWIKLNENTTKAADATLTQVAAASAVPNGLIETTFTEIRIPEHPEIEGIHKIELRIRLKRLAAGALDTIVDVVHLCGIVLHFAKKEGM